MNKKNSCIYIVNSFKDLPIIIAHFDKYPLITQKQADYILYKRVISLIVKGEHLTSALRRKV